MEFLSILLLWFIDWLFSSCFLFQIRDELSAEVTRVSAEMEHHKNTAHELSKALKKAQVSQPHWNIQGTKMTGTQPTLGLG